MWINFAESSEFRGLFFLGAGSDLHSHFAMFTPPIGYSRIRVVQSFDELIGTPFGDGVNAFCWPRSLPGDFAEVLRSLPAEMGINTIDDDLLPTLALSDAGRAAADFILSDLSLLREHGLDPNLDCVHGYVREKEESPVRTDVYSFHVDSATVPAETWLCTYVGASSEGLRNDQAIRRVDVPSTRAELLRLFGGSDGESFREYLHENCFDLHYAALEHARPFAFGLGNLWRIALEYPGCVVPPCIHRAPETLPGDPPRLLLIS